MEADQGNNLAGNCPSRPSRYFNWKDRHYFGERSIPTVHTTASSAQTTEINTKNDFHKNANYKSHLNFYQSLVGQQSVANVAVDSNTIQDDSVSNLHPSETQGFSRDESDINNAANIASSSTIHLVTGQSGNNKSFTKQKPIKKRDMVKLNDVSVRKLLTQEGTNFLQKLSDETKVKIKVIPQGKNKKFQYACALQGSRSKINQVKNSIKSYCYNLLKDAKLLEAEEFNLMKAFQGETFEMKVLEESLSKIENPNVNWAKLTNNLHKRIKETWGKFNEATRKSQFGKMQELKNVLRSQYTAFHAVLLGKLDLEDGPLHLAVLKLALKNGITEESDVEAVRNSYNYIFRSSERLSINYVYAISCLPPHVSLQTEIDDLFKSGVSICERNNMKVELGKLKSTYNNLIHCHYSERKIFQFRRLYDDIKGSSEK